MLCFDSILLMQTSNYLTTAYLISGGVVSSYRNHQPRGEVPTDHRPDSVSKLLIAKDAPLPQCGSRVLQIDLVVTVQRNGMSNRLYTHCGRHKATHGTNTAWSLS